MNKALIIVLLLLGSFPDTVAQDTCTVPHRVKSGKVRQYEKKTLIQGSTTDVFDFMDNVENTGMHMTKRNAPMMGGRFTMQWLSPHKIGLGSKYRWQGRVIGMKMDFSVEVTKWERGRNKTWESIGDGSMLVISWYRMYLGLYPQPDGTTQACLGIYYTRSRKFLGFLLGKAYSKWCVRSMLRDTKEHFKKIHRVKQA